MSYDLRPMKAPRSAGGLLQLLALMAELPAVGPWFAKTLARNTGIHRLREVDLDAALPPFHPILGKVDPSWLAESEPISQPALPCETKLGFHFETAQDFINAYLDHLTNPVEVAERILAATRQSDQQDPPLRAFIAQDAGDLLAQAQASLERYRQGRPRGPLDGMPVAIKDELDAFPYPTTVGTRFLGQSPAAQDAEVVARLRREGALIIGKTNMSEIGAGVTGINPHHGTPRNPYDLQRVAGGSSGGSAAAVAAGLCPVAVGADGGGSVRIPAALCGLVGLKPTYGRVSESGAFPLCWSVAHLGPIATSVRDAWIAYLVMAGPDPKDPNTHHQPPVFLNGDDSCDLTGIRLGIYRPWFEDADPEVLRVCHGLLEQLQESGIELVEVTIPELDLASLAHTVTIISEMLNSQLPYFERDRTQYGWELRLTLALAQQLQAIDYVQAQRIRHRFFQNLDQVLAGVDAIVTPTTAIAAPRVPMDALKTGESNMAVLEQIMRFIKPANLTGLPAISFPAGYTREGLPVGLHLMGRAWDEPVLLKIACKAEQFVERIAPQRHFRLLKTS